MSGKRRQNGFQRLRHNHIAQYKKPGKSNCTGCLPLPFANRLNSGSYDFCNIGPFKNGKTDQAGKKIGEQIDRTKQQFHDRKGAGRGISTHLVKSQQWNDLAADKEIKDEDKDNRRDIPDQFNIQAAADLEKQVVADSAQSHDDSDYSSNQGPPERQPQRHRDTFQKQVGEYFTGYFINSNDVLENQRPIPGIDQDMLHPVVGVYHHRNHNAQYRNIKQRDPSGFFHRRRQSSFTHVKPSIQSYVFPRHWPGKHKRSCNLTALQPGLSRFAP